MQLFNRKIKVFSKIVGWSIMVKTNRGVYKMNVKDKWNLKHSDRLTHLKEPQPNPRLKKLASYFKEGGTALDIACGLGGNSLFLAGMNNQVEAIDISDVAINHVQELAAKENLSVQPRVADLTEMNALSRQNDPFDFIIMSYYLDRSLFPVVKDLLKNGGYFFMETYYQSPFTQNQMVSDQFKLQSNELLAEFGDWKVLYFEENEQEGWQSIFCQKR
jgi:tellurite methyltransferase